MADARKTFQWFVHNIMNTNYKGTILIDKTYSDCFDLDRQKVDSRVEYTCSTERMVMPTTNLIYKYNIHFCRTLLDVTINQEVRFIANMNHCSKTVGISFLKIPNYITPMSCHAVFEDEIFRTLITPHYKPIVYNGIYLSNFIVFIRKAIDKSRNHINCGETE